MGNEKSRFYVNIPNALQFLDDGVEEVLGEEAGSFLGDIIFDLDPFHSKIKIPNIVIINV